MGKRKTTIYVDEDLLRAARVFAARAGVRDSEVVERALRAFLGIEVLEQIWARSELGEEEAMRLAYEALRESRTRSANEAAELSDPEMRVLAEIATGKTVGEVAEELHVSESSVMNILAAVGRKLAPSGTHSVRELAR